MTKLMGILNATPDSFFNKFPNLDAAIEHAKKIYTDGADIIDIGGESTRPGAQKIPENEELARTIPLIKALHTIIPIPISIDTCKPKVAAEAVNAGATLINDVCGFSDPAMQEVAASSNVDICVMHMQGTPETMQLNPHYPEGIIPNIINWFEKQIELLISKGVKENHIILDPGIGFGKTVAHNLEIIQNLPKLKNMGFRLLLGVSRKSFMSKILNKTAADLLPATIAVNTILIMSHVDIIRVHDVSEHRGVIDILAKMKDEVD